MLVSCPFHEERTPSCNIFWGNQDKWVYYCHGCGASGDDITYLTEYRRIPMKEAMQMRNGKDLSAKHTHIHTPVKPQNTPRKPARDVLKELPSNHSARYEYRYKDGSMAFVIHRYEGKKGKFFGQYTPQADGTWIKGMTVEKNRPLYHLQDVINAQENRQIMVVEGEKCADRVKEAFASTVVCTWACGINSANLTDWSPLYGRPVLLVADSNAQGYLGMAVLARVLAGQRCSVTVVLPPLTWDKDAEIDIADVIEQDAQSVPDWIRENAAPWNDELDARMQKLQASIQAREKKKRTRQIQVAKLKKNERFQVLQVNGNKISIDIRGQGQTSMDFSVLAKPHVLLGIHPDQDFWREMTGEAVSARTADRIARLIFK